MKVGDKVQLKAAHLGLEVKKISGGTVTCVWESDGVKYTNEFDSSMLERFGGRRRGSVRFVTK